MRRVVFNQKGGVGKSSITCNLAAISAAQGLRTLVVDLDVQGNASYYLGVDIHSPQLTHPEATIAHLLRQSASAWFSNALPAIQFVRETHFPKLDLLAASPLLNSIAPELESRYKIYKLKEILDELSAEYDRIYIDTPPNFNFFSKTALIAAQRVLIPYDCDSFSKQGLNQLLENLVDLKQDHNPHLTIEGIIINQYNPQARLPNELIQQLKTEGLPVLNAFLPSSVKMKESHHARAPLIHFAKGHKLTQHYQALFNEIEALPQPA